MGNGFLALGCSESHLGKKEANMMDKEASIRSMEAIIRGPEEHYWQKRLKSAETFLKRWNGGSARIWHFQVSHCSLTIRIEKTGARGNLHINCGGPEFIHGPFRWDDCAIDIQIETDEKGEAVRYLVRDEKADFELRTENISIAENCKPIYKPE